MPRGEILLLGEVIDAAEQANLLVSGRDVDALEADRQLRDALLWNVTVLGEASAQGPDEIKEAHPTVNWARPSQLRNRIVHGYWSIDLEILHAAASDERPAFVTQLKAVLGTSSRRPSGSIQHGRSAFPGRALSRAGDVPLGASDHDAARWFTGSGRCRLGGRWPRW